MRERGDMRLGREGGERQEGEEKEEKIEEQKKGERSWVREKNREEGKVGWRRKKKIMKLGGGEAQERRK